MNMEIRIANDFGEDGECRDGKGRRRGEKRK